MKSMPKPAKTRKKSVPKILPTGPAGRPLPRFSRKPNFMRSLPMLFLGLFGPVTRQLVPLLYSLPSLAARGKSAILNLSFTSGQ